MKEVKNISPAKFGIIVSAFGLVIATAVLLFTFLPSFTTVLEVNVANFGLESAESKLPTPRILVYFNKGVDSSYREGAAREAMGNADFAEIISEKIDGAADTVDLAVMHLDDTTVIDAIKEADKRGVKVRVITDFVDFKALSKALKGTNVEVIDNNGGLLEDGYGDEKSIMHCKFGLFDVEDAEKASLITTSANWTAKDFNLNSNNLLVIQDFALVNAYLDEFEQMWGGKFNRDKDLSKHKGEVFDIDGRKVELWMSPAADPFVSFQVRYLNLLSAAKKSIYFATFNFTLSRLGDELGTKFAQGLEVKGVANDGSWDINGSVFLDMRGVEHLKGYKAWEQVPFENIRHDAIEGKATMHDKYFVIDDEIVMTGAGNPTVSSVFTNDEDILIVHDPLLANEFKQNFYYQFRKFGGVTKDSKVEIVNFDDVEDSVEIKNISEEIVNLAGWKIVTVEGVYSTDELSPKNEFPINLLEMKPGESVKVDVPADFITDNNQQDKFPHTNSVDDGEIYLFDNFDLLQHMIWY